MNKPLEWNQCLTRLFDSPAYKREQSTYVRNNMILRLSNTAIGRWRRWHKIPDSMLPETLL